jgi:hypothetical protein
MTHIQYSSALKPVVWYRPFRICCRYRTVSRLSSIISAHSRMTLALSIMTQKSLLSDGHLGGRQYLGSRDEAPSTD